MSMSDFPWLTVFYFIVQKEGFSDVWTLQGLLKETNKNRIFFLKEWRNKTTNGCLKLQNLVIKQQGDKKPDKKEKAESSNVTN